jgi:hypothetical protein
MIRRSLSIITVFVAINVAVSDFAPPAFSKPYILMYLIFAPALEELLLYKTYKLCDFECENILKIGALFSILEIGVKLHSYMYLNEITYKIYFTSFLSYFDILLFPFILHIINSWMFCIIYYKYGQKIALKSCILAHFLFNYGGAIVWRTIEADLAVVLWQSVLLAAMAAICVRYRHARQHGGRGWQTNASGDGR